MRTLVKYILADSFLLSFFVVDDFLRSPENVRQHFLRELAGRGILRVNNIVERALKRAVLHRKNALFYRTLRGAQVGDLFMSLIHTCQLCGTNSFDYLVELQRHAQEPAAQPAGWTP